MGQCHVGHLLIQVVAHVVATRSFLFPNFQLGIYVFFYKIGRWLFFDRPTVTVGNKITAEPLESCEETQTGNKIQKIDLRK